MNIESDFLEPNIEGIERSVVINDGQVMVNITDNQTTERLTIREGVDRNLVESEREQKVKIPYEVSYSPQRYVCCSTFSTKLD